MVGQVDEASVLKPFEDGLSGLSTLIWGAVEEEREVDKLRELSSVFSVSSVCSLKGSIQG